MSVSKYPLNFKECKRSNLLVTGTNQQGKSLLAMAISDMLMRRGWQVIVFDNVGHWKVKSSIPLYYQVSEKTMKYILPRGSIIYDTSRLLPFMTREFVEMVLHDIWKLKLDNPLPQWLLIVLEEAHLYMRNIRGLVSQNLMRICSVGANHRVRTLAISPSLTGMDTEFIRLAQQRYHFKLGCELNSKRRFRGYYSKDWQIVAEHLDVGETIYYNNGEMKVWKLPLFKSNVSPMAYRQPTPKPQPKRGIIQTIRQAITKSNPNEETFENEEYDWDEFLTTEEEWQ